MKYKVSCHCGKVALEFEGDVREGLACNCSICQRKGSLLAFMPYDKLKWLAGEKEAATYTFNRHVIKHRFCPTCGMHTHGEGTDPKGNKTAAVNMRCVEGIDLSTLAVKHFDGRAL
jgi:hypothetical protein